MVEFERHFPSRFRGSEKHRPFFRRSDGSWILRKEARRHSEPAAAAFDVGPPRMGTHSLRIGGPFASTP
eukprot:8683013-Lingulodinium_polyedra.AAC.1